MKKIFATLFAASLMLLGTQSFAQIVPGAGYLHVIEQAKYADSGESAADDFHTNGFYVGASYKIGLGDYFGVAPGFYVNMLFKSVNKDNGATIAGIPVGGATSYNYTEIALNVPVNVTFKYHFTDNVGFVAFAGPTFQYGVMARSTFHGSLSIGSLHFSDGDSYNHYGKDGDSNPFNILLGGGIGFQAGDLLFTVGYDHTLLNCSKKDTGLYTGAHLIKAGINFAF